MFQNTEVNVSRRDGFSETHNNERKKNVNLNLGYQKYVTIKKNLSMLWEGSLRNSAT